MSRCAATTPRYSQRSATRRAWRWSRRWRPARPRSIAQLTGGSRITRQAITKHLRVLESAGVVRSARRGRQSLFELDPAPLTEMQEYLGRVAEQWDQVLGRLKSLVES